MIYNFGDIMFRPTKSEFYEPEKFIFIIKFIMTHVPQDPQGFKVTNIIIYKYQLHIYGVGICLQKYYEISKKYKNMGKIQKIL